MLATKQQAPLLLLIMIRCILAQPGALSSARRALPARACNTADQYCDRLAAFYIHTEGHSWRNSTNWLTNASYCDWHGISCDNNNTTPQRLHFFDNLLGGALPSEVGQMPGVEQLLLFNESKLR